MASGCAVIASTDVAAHIDLITPGLDGILYPTGNVAALTAALQLVFSTPQTAEYLGRAAAHRMQSWSFEEDVHALRSALAAVTHMPMQEPR